MITFGFYPYDKVRYHFVLDYMCNYWSFPVGSDHIHSIPYSYTVSSVSGGIP